MSLNTSSLSRANSALRAGQLEEAVRLYGATRREDPHLTEFVDFNLGCIGRVLQSGEDCPLLVASEYAVPYPMRLPEHDVLLVVLARSLRQAGETARIFARRAEYPINVVVLLTDPQSTSTKEAVKCVLGQVESRYALVVAEDAFPANEWLRYAIEGLQAHCSDGVYANEGRIDSNREQSRWLHLFSSPALLIDELDRGETAVRYPKHDEFLVPQISHATPEGGETAVTQGQVHVVETGEMRGSDEPRFLREICVVMPCIDIDVGLKTANLLLRRAGIDVDIVVAVDTSMQGFIPTLNQAARCSSGDYIVYLAQDAWPGDDWLRTAYERIRREGKKVLAFNCGKWHGRVASFGMVKKGWAFELYGEQLLFEGYQSHRADNELTVIARALGEFVYDAASVVMEHDVEKVFRGSERSARNFRRSDARLFRERFRGRFDGLVDEDALISLHDEYLHLSSHYENRPKLRLR